MAAGNSTVLNQSFLFKLFSKGEFLSGPPLVAKMCYIAMNFHGASGLRKVGGMVVMFRKEYKASVT